MTHRFYCFKKTLHKLLLKIYVVEFSSLSLSHMHTRTHKQTNKKTGLKYGWMDGQTDM